MATTITKLIERDYLLKRDEGADKPTVFRLRPLTGLQKIAVRQAIAQGDDEKTHRLLLTHGLAGWSELRDGDGKPVAWAPNNIARNIDCLDEDTILELAREIFESSFLSDEERKNLSSPST